MLKTEFSVDMALITARHKEATVALAELPQLSIENDEDASNANDYLKIWLRQLDAVSAAKKHTLAPLKEAQKRIDELFKPLLDKGAELTGGVRRLLEGYELEKRRAQREAMNAAAEAAQSPEPEALLEALQRAEEAAPTQLEGASFIRTWVVKRIAEDLLPDDYWTPDRKKIEAVGKAHKGDTAPVIPGVIWQEELLSRIRR